MTVYKTYTCNQRGEVWQLVDHLVCVGARDIRIRHIREGEEYVDDPYALEHWRVWAEFTSDEESLGE